MGSAEIDPKWSKVFSIIEKESYGTNLTFSERYKIRNGYAFLFGPFYYFFKGMHRKGAALFALYIIFVGIAENIFVYSNSNFPKYLPWIAIACVVSEISYRDYYKYKTLNESMWPNLKLIDRSLIAFSLPIIMFFALVLLDYYSDFNNNISVKHDTSSASPELLDGGRYSRINSGEMCQEGAVIARKLILKAQLSTPQFDELMRERDVDMSRVVIIDKKSITLDEHDLRTGNMKCSVDWKFDIEKWQEEFRKLNSIGKIDTVTSPQGPDIFGGNNVAASINPIANTLKIINSSNPRIYYQVKPIKDGRIWVEIITKNNKDD